ncbi:Crp/Fnr family transcriptional regulator [Chitinophaga sp. 22321]|uniref:Crp/Fnr family transcriptional regulator n=1 Tax=Chitinophaga hostae TaxID=2831022 RepID=A0ABS5J3U2_9BACT|nr:Crp/Fnr family transcriptional regulator [Chitinophaga hostae]MBS0029899.1 Crp/Fnr family transcriptional regulator [Chitinophaga hostae]
MENELLAFLSKLDVFTGNEIDELGNLLTVKTAKKNTVIVKQGQVCCDCYFVLKGCLRQYVISDGAEKTIAFYTEEQAINFYTSAVQKKPSQSFLISLEDTVLLVGNPEINAGMFARFPKLEQLTRKMMEEYFGQTQDSFAEFMTSSPEERYLNLLTKRPELMQRVSLSHLASYLGITPASLSRIRKRIIKK